jgi:uncharacterized protein
VRHSPWNCNVPDTGAAERHIVPNLQHFTKFDGNIICGARWLAADMVRLDVTIPLGWGAGHEEIDDRGRCSPCSTGCCWLRGQSADRQGTGGRQGLISLQTLFRRLKPRPRAGVLIFGALAKPKYSTEEDEMGFDQYHEPARELSQKTRTFARMVSSIIEEAEAINWYEQRISVEKNRDARAIMHNAQKEEFKHFGMGLEFLLRAKPEWRKELRKILFTSGDIVAAGEKAEKAVD